MIFKRGFRRRFISRVVTSANPERTKYGAKWTKLDDLTLHTTGRDCPLHDAERCPTCSRRTRAESERWYPSRVEANYARTLEILRRAGQIREWRRSKSVTLVEGSRAERVTYKADFDVWKASDPEADSPDERIEIKGSRLAVSRDATIRIRLYRAAARRGEQPPLRVLDGQGREIVL